MTATIIFVSHAGWYAAHTTTFLLSEAVLGVDKVNKFSLLIRPLGISESQVG